MDIVQGFADPKEFKFIELELLQPEWTKRYFELKFDEELLATIQWPTWFKTTAHGKTAFGEWTIKRVGIFKPKISVRLKGSKRDLYVLKMKSYRKGTIQMDDRKVVWDYIQMWKSEVGWIENDRDVMTFRLSYSLTKKRFAKIRMIKTDYSEEELSVLLLVGLYMIHMIAQSNG
ncbi:MAG: hypothetical protein AAF502_18780 [Bacteroidota bacterium]